MTRDSELNHRRRHGPADSTLDQQLYVRRTRLVAIKAVLERVPELIEMEVLGAATIGAVEERTMFDFVGHTGAAAALR